MKPDDFGRRNFILRSALALSAATLPTRLVFGATQFTRPEWQAFKMSPQYSSFLNAVSAMKANTDPSNPASWAYWTNVHVNYCPHGISYFFAWHRGYLYHFENQLRTVSKDSSLILPYWDYYSYSQMPSEFTDSSNPLYMKRQNTNVYQALTLAPFSSKIVNFPRGMSNAFEPNYESAPHNPVHNIIGTDMATMQSPNDPIFWLHHCNCDRLWVAWVSGGGRRKMPLQSDSYWDGTFTYSNTLNMVRRNTYDTTTNLNYTYQNTKMPTALPATAQREPHMVRVQASANVGTPALPPISNFQQSGARATSDTTYSLSGALNVGLDERSVSVQLPIGTVNSKVLETIAGGNPSSISGSSKLYRSVQIVFNDLQLTQSARQGGFYYEIYLNLPPAGDTATPADSSMIGTLGPFEISGAAHHGNTPVLRYVITGMLVGLSATQIAALTVSFLRVDGANSPRGPAIGVGEVRVELSSENVQS